METHFSSVLININGEEITLKNCIEENLTPVVLKDNETGFIENTFDHLIFQIFSNEMKSHYMASKIVTESLLSGKKKTDLFHHINRLRRLSADATQDRLNLFQDFIQYAEEMENSVSFAERQKKFQQIQSSFQEQKTILIKIRGYTEEVLDRIEEAVDFSKIYGPPNNGLSENFWQLLVNSVKTAKEILMLEGLVKTQALTHTEFVKNDICALLNEGYQLNSKGRQLADQLRKVIFEFRAAKKESFKTISAVDRLSIRISKTKVNHLSRILDDMWSLRELHLLWLEDLQQMHKLSSKIWDLQREIVDKGFSKP